MKAFHLQWLASALLSLLLAGCGPGVGGTGTGKGFAYFEATPALVCQGDIAATLTCARTDGVTTAGTPATLQEGTAVAHFADTPAGANVRVDFAANSVELDAPCRRLHFTGDWGITASNDARFFGTYTDNAGTEPLPASLQVQAVLGESRNQISVTVRDGGGRIVLGPVMVQRVEITPPAAGC